MTLRSLIVVSDSASVDGGAAKVAIETARIMKRRGLEVTLFAGGTEMEPGLDPDITVELSGHPAMSTGTRSLRSALRGVWDHATAQRLREILQEFNPRETVVHFHSWGSRLSPSVFGAVRKSGFAAAITAHDYLLTCPNSCLYIFPEQRICDRRPASVSCIMCSCDRVGRVAKVFRVARFAAQGIALRGLRPTVAYVSDFQRQRADPTVSFKHDSYVIRNPIDVPSMSADYRGTTGPILCTGRIEGEKGMDLFCEAVGLAGTSGVVVGAGAEREGLITAYPMVEYVPWMAPAALYETMLSSRALVFPSRWYEAAPLTPLEAQLVAALPCVVSDACAARDMVEHGVTGFTFRSGDADDLARCLRQLADPEVHAMLRKNIALRQPTIRGQYAKDSYAAAVETFYENVLKQHLEATGAKGRPSEDV